VEIGDIIETPEETAPSKRKRSKRAASNGNGSSRDAHPVLRAELETLLEGLKDLRDGDFEFRLPTSTDPLIAEIYAAFNGIAERNERLSSEVIRVSTTIGRSAATVPGARVRATTRVER